MRRAVSAFVPEVQAQAKAASLLLLQIVREYFKDPVHRAEFEDWYSGYPTYRDIRMKGSV